MVTIFADTTSSIPLDQAKIMGIEYLPQIIIFGDTSYRDDTELNTRLVLGKINFFPNITKNSRTSTRFISATV